MRQSQGPPSCSLDAFAVMGALLCKAVCSLRLVPANTFPPLLWKLLLEPESRFFLSSFLSFLSSSCSLPREMHLRWLLRVSRWREMATLTECELYDEEVARGLTNTLLMDVTDMLLNFADIGEFLQIPTDLRPCLCLSFFVVSHANTHSYRYSTSERQGHAGSLIPNPSRKLTFPTYLP